MDATEKGIIVALLRIARLIGIAPSEQPSRFGHLYQLFILCVSVSVSVFSMVQMGRQRFAYMSAMQAFTDIVTSVSIMVQGVSVQAISLLCPTAWRKLFGDLQIGNKTAKTGGSERIYLELLILHLVFFAWTVWNTNVWLEVEGFRIYKYYVFRLIHEYCTMVSIALMVHVNLIIKERFRAISVALNLSPTLLLEKLEMQNRISCSYIRHLQANYRKLTQLIEHFNFVFGYQILFTLANSICAMLESLHVSLTLDFSLPNSSLVLSWSAISTLIVMVTTKAHQSTLSHITICFLQVEVTTIVMSCESVSMEAAKIVSVCLEVQEKMPTPSWERKEIYKLLTVTSTKTGLYTAANYFVLFRGTLFSLLSVTTTYFIIMVQFNLAK